MMKRADHDFQMNVLFADGDSRFLTKSRAVERGSNHKEWKAVQSYVEGGIDAIKHAGVNIIARRHSEPYLWRLFFFDETLYFMPYLYKKENHNRAPVFKISSKGKEEGVIYSTFMQYFSDVWDKNFDKECCNEHSQEENTHNK